jgi:MoxR-like ATPase
MNMTDKERSTIRRQLIAAGVRTAGLTDEQMKAKAEQLGQPEPAVTLEPAEPIPAKREKAPKTPSEPRKADPVPSPTSEPKAAQNGLNAAVAALVSELAQTRAASLDEDRVVELIREHGTAQPQPIKVEVATHTGTVVKIDGAHKVLPEVLDWLSMDEHVYIYGPASSGKTHVARQCAEALGLELFTMTAILQKYEMTGYEDANGVYRDTEFSRWYQNGGLLLWDECDGSLPSAFLPANAGVENRFMAFPGLGTVEMHPDCKLIASANTVGTGANQQYTGRHALDRATLDRFAQVFMDYDTALERSIALAVYSAMDGADERAANQLVDWFHAVRAQTLQKGMTHLVTGRAIRRGIKVLAKHGPTAEAGRRVQGATFSMFSEDQRRDVINGCASSWPFAA